MKSAFSRLFIALLVILMVTISVISVSLQWLANNYVKTQAIESLQNDAKVIASLFHAGYQNGNMPAQDFHMALTVAISVSGADAVICNADGKILFCADAPMGCEHVGLQLDSAYRNRVFATGGCSDTGIIGGLYEENRYMVSVPVTDDITGAPKAIILVSSPVDTTFSTLRRVTSTFLIVAFLMALVAILAMTYFVRRQSNPLRSVAKAARSFGHGQFGARVTTSGHNAQEVEELALAFNNMATSLEKSEYQRQEFVANISHELKTPMTTISGYVDGILDGTVPPEKQRHYLQLVSDETKRLSRLVRNMLDISRLQEEKGIPEEQKSRFDLSEMTGQVLISFEQKILEKNLDVQVDMPEHPVYTRANSDAINQVIYNLVDNAVKFCTPEGTLGITLQERGNKIYLSVSNDGEEIPAQELPLVFERFHKIDKSRSQNRDSWGLGLYIVKTLINAHRENISVTSEKGKTSFTFTLPQVP